MSLVTVAKLSPKNQGNLKALVQYMTAGLRATRTEFSSAELRSVVGYYAQDHTQARWWGGSCEKLGLEVGSRVDPKSLERLLQGLSPLDGSKLPNNRTQGPTVVAYDIVFSVEKDLSLLWLAADEATRHEIEDIIHVSNSFALNWLEEEAAVVRRGKAGLVHRSASGFAAMRVGHSTARPVDGLVAPHLHEHVLTSVLAEHEGMWTSLDGTRIFNLQRATASIASQKIRELTQQRLNLAWELDDKGLYRVRGVEASLREKFSLRQRQLLDKVISEGGDVTDRTTLIAAQRSSREGKSKCGSDLEQLTWALAGLAEAGFTFESQVATSQALEESDRLALNDQDYVVSVLGQRPDNGLAAKDWNIAAVRLLAAKDVGELTNQLVGTQPSLDFTRLNRSMKVHRYDREKAIGAALLAVGRGKSTWRREDLLVALTSIDIPLDEATQRLEAYINSNEVVYFSGRLDNPTALMRVRRADQEIFTTRETLQKEAELLLAAQSGLGAATPLIAEAQFREVLDALADEGMIIDPDSDQLRMLEKLLLGGDAMNVVQGQAGTGKSAGMRGLVVADSLVHDTAVVAKEGEAMRYRLLGLTLAATAALNLTKESGMPAMSVAMFLAHITAGTLVLDEGAVIVVDECSQASTQQLHMVHQHVSNVSGRLILVGDSAQLASIEAGGLFTTMTDVAPEAVVFLEEIRRQENLDERVILSGLHDRGHLTSRSLRALERQGADPKLIKRVQELGIREIAKWYQENQRVDTYTSLGDALYGTATKYWNVVAAHPNMDASSVVGVMATTNGEVARMDQAIIDEAIVRGLLDGDKEIEFGSRRLLIGQRIGLRKNENWRMHVRNGQDPLVEGVSTKVTSWRVELAKPGQRLVRTLYSEPTIEGDVAVNFSAGQVASERKKARKYLEGRTELLARATARDKVSPTNLDKRRVEIEEAQQWCNFAESLPDGGGTVSLRVESCEEKARENVLLVRQADGTQSELTEAYVERHTASGYVRTTTREQGATVLYSMGFNTMEYVPLSRGKLDNRTILVVPEIDPEVIDGQREHLAVTTEWISAKVGSKASEMFAGATKRLRSDRTSETLLVDDTTRAIVSNNARTVPYEIARQVSEDRRSGVKTVALARTREQAGEISDNIVRDMARTSRGAQAPAKLGERLWIAGQQIIVTGERLGDLVHGDIATITAISGGTVILKGTKGPVVETLATELMAHCVSGVAITVARAMTLEPEATQSLVLYGAGLSSDDLNWVDEQQKEVTVRFADVDVAAEVAYQEQIDAEVNTRLLKAIGVNANDLSAHDVRRSLEPERGLESLQAEVKLCAKRLDEVAHLSPPELAKRDLDVEITEAIAHRNELEVLTKGYDVEREQDRADARAGVAPANARIAELVHRHEVVSRKAGTDAERVAEIAKCQTAHQLDGERLAAAEHALKEYTRARVSEARKNPRPYHPTVEIGPAVDPVAAHHAHEELLAEIEDYRVRWAVNDPATALGPCPDGGRQAQEWAEVMRILDAAFEEELVISQ